MINVAVMGYGTIGSGVVEILAKNKDIIADKVGQEVRLKAVLDLRDFPGTDIEDKVVHDISDIVNDKEIHIVVETMGGTKPAYDFVKACLEAGKHVATSNKALVAAHGTDLLATAREHSVNFLFEASVGGGIPIIRTMNRCLVGEQIEEITGILNGTTNYILTKMDKEGESFENALKEAQELGYAERNPEADIEGHDTCRKIAILTACATGREVDYEDIYTEGITKIDAIDFKYADSINASIKLFGSSRIEKDKVYAYVLPKLIGKDNPLYSVSDVYNGIMIKSNMLGTSMYYGSGAGKLPTASAVITDIIEAAQNINSNIYPGWNDKKERIMPIGETTFAYFLRISGSISDNKEAVEKLFGKVEFYSLDGFDECAVLTETMTENTFEEKIKGLNGILNIIRAEL